MNLKQPLKKDKKTKKTKKTKKQKKQEKNNLKRERKNMNYNYFTRSYVSNPKTETLIEAWNTPLEPVRFGKILPTDTYDDNLIHIQLFQQSALNKIADIALPAAGGCEFQVHYCGAQFQYNLPDGKRLIFTIPTHFFNFEQDVSSALVEYYVKHIKEGKDRTLPKTEELFLGPLKANGDRDLTQGIYQIWDWERILKLLPAGTVYEHKVTTGEFGSIHRHPGRFSFSQTDRTKSPDKPGVIYRWSSAKNLVVTDTVIYIEGKGKQTEVIATEARRVDVKDLGEDVGIEGTYAEGKNLTVILQDIPDAKEPYLFNQHNLNLGKDLKTALADSLAMFVSHVQLEPELDVDPKKIHPNTYGFGWQGWGKNKTNLLDTEEFDYDDYYDDYYNDDDDDYITTGIPATKGKPSTLTKSPKLIQRPAHLRVKTLNALIKTTLEFPKSHKELADLGITGNMDIDDIIAVCTYIDAIWQMDKHKSQITKFLVTAGYPENTLDQFYSAMEKKILAESVKEEEEEIAEKNFEYLPNKILDGLKKFKVPLTEAQKGEINGHVNSADEIATLCLVLLNQDWVYTDIEIFLGEYYSTEMVKAILSKF